MSVYGRFFQLGYVVRDIDAAVRHCRQRMGATLVDIIRDLRTEAGEQVSINNLSHLAMPGAEIELIEPRPDWPSIYLDALPEKGGGLGFHHLGFVVPDQQAWDRAMATIDTFGTPLAMAGATSQVRFAYLDTRRLCGHYSEIVWRYDPANSRPLP
ncbi:MAG: VOC family protein [Porticoccaceae bacterium]